MNGKKAYYDTKVRELTVMVEEVSVLRKELVQYLSLAANLINHADYYYQLSSPEMKNLIVSSIFSKKLIYENGKYRTPESNEIIAEIARFTDIYKAQKTTVSGDLSLTVARLTQIYNSDSIKEAIYQSFRSQSFLLKIQEMADVHKRVTYELLEVNHTVKQ